MTKAELKNVLNEKLQGVPEKELNRSIDFYMEMIDDRMEDGISEEDAVAAVGDVKEIADSILTEIPMSKIVKEKVKNVKPKRGLKPWEIVLLALGFPIWFPVTLSIGLVALVLVLVFYLVYWVFILVFYLIDLCFALGGIAGIVYGVLAIAKVGAAQGFGFIGAGLFLCGLGVAFFFLCNIIAKGMIALSKNIGRGIKYLFVGRRKKNSDTADEAGSDPDKGASEADETGKTDRGEIKTADNDKEDELTNGQNE